MHSISVKIKQNIKSGRIYFLRADVKNFFENIDHTILIDRIKFFDDKELTEIINSFLMTPWEWENRSNVSSPDMINKLGVPPGSAISQSLSYIYLHLFDNVILEYAKKYEDVYFRYTDDICYLSSDCQRISKVKEIIIDELSKLKLTLNFNKLLNGNSVDGFDYLGFTHSRRGISLSDDSLNYIKSNLIMFYKSVYSSIKSFQINCSSKSRQGFNLWKNISLRINSSIRGYSKYWKNSTIRNEHVYGIARYLSITDDLNQIKMMDKWLRRLNKYYCYKICEDAQIPKIFIELESLFNWVFKYKKNLSYAIESAYVQYQTSQEINYNWEKANPEIKEGENLFKEYLDNYNDYIDENEYVRIDGNTYISLDGMFNNDGDWYPIPENLNVY